MKASQNVIAMIDIILVETSWGHTQAFHLLWVNSTILQIDTKPGQDI